MKFIWLALALASQIATADGLSVQKLNHLLAAKKIGWVAKQTNISQLSHDQARRMMGLRRDQDPNVEFENRKTTLKAGLPSALDWRNKDGLNWVSPLLDQANCGSCVAFAAVATLETQYKIASGIAAFNIKLSPQHLFSCGGGSCDFGWWPESAASYLVRTGIPDEACFPYTSGATGRNVMCSKTCNNAPSRSLKIASYATPSRSVTDLNAVKQALQQGPLVTTLMVYEDFLYYAGGVYKHVAGDMVGGHAVSIVGYDDKLRAFIIRNSWGETWGEQGFGNISYDDISGIGDETWAYKIPAMGGAVSVHSPIDYTYVRNNMTVDAQSTFPGTDSLNVVIYNADGMITTSAFCSGSKCEQSIDVSQFADGRYEVVVKAMNSFGQSLGQSTNQFFYVANQTPALTLTFEGEGTDLDRPQRGRIEMAVHASSSTVPMSSVEFHYRGADGVDHKRVANIVTDGLVMGWRTGGVPNGRYEVWMVGRVKTNNGETIVESAHRNIQIAN